MENDGIEECLCLILEPHYSYYSVMGYEKFLESEQIKFQIIKDWYRDLTFSTIGLMRSERF